LSARLWFRSSCLFIGLVVSIAGRSQASLSCHLIVLAGELQSGNHFEKAIGGNLVFRLEPELLGPKGEIHGWRISLVSSRAPEHDYIYPVNPPLRFNGLQMLGPSYGDDTKTSLVHPHEMRFLLDRAGYNRISPLLTNALWPYSAPHPDRADDEYISALKALNLGQLKFTVRDYDADAVSGSIRKIDFQAQFTAPDNFEFDPALKPRPAACPDRAE
jgi:hypothetical protein